MSSDKQLDVVQALNYSANLVQKFGKYKFENGKTLIQLLTINGISFWDLITSELAQTHFPIVLSTNKKTNKKIDNLIFLYSVCKLFLKKIIQKTKCNKKYINFPANDSIICLGFSNQSYRDIMIPIVQELANSTPFDILVISDQKLPSIIDTLPANCIFNINRDYLDKSVNNDIKKINTELKKIFQFLIANNFLNKVIPEHEKYLLKEFRFLFKRIFYLHLPRIVDHAVISANILNKIKPKCIITPDSSDPKSRAFTLVGNRLDIPSLSIQFGLVGEEAVEWRFLSTDFVAVWGESSRRAILKQKVPDTKIEITGSPRYDFLNYRNNERKNIYKSRFKIKDKQCVILLASTYGDQSISNSSTNLLDKMKKDIFDSINKLSDCILIIKPHPSENIQDTKKLVNDFQNIQLANKNVDIRELIEICDIFISFGSTATIDALVADKLTICPIYPGWKFSDIFKDSEATLNPTNKEEIYELLKDIVLLNNQNFYLEKLKDAKSSFLQDQTYKNDFNSTVRILSLINRIKINE